MALALGAVLVGTAFTMLGVVSGARREEAMLLDLAARSRALVRLLGADLARTRLGVCGDSRPALSQANGNLPARNFDDAVAMPLLILDAGSTALATDPYLGTISAQVQAGTQAIKLLVADTPSPLDRAMASPTATIPLVGGGERFAAGELALVEDCSAADLFRVSSVIGRGSPSARLGHALSRNLTAGLSRRYGPDAMVWPLSQRAYYIRDTGRQQDGIPVLSLYLRQGARSEELISGVSGLQLRRRAGPASYSNIEIQAQLDARGQSRQQGLLRTGAQGQVLLELHTGLLVPEG